MRNAAEMDALFRDLPEAIANTGELSDRLGFQMKDMGYEFPRYPSPRTKPWTASCASAPSRV